MTFSRRLTLFMIGLGLGTILSIALFGKGCSNTAWAPEARVKLRMKSTLVHSTPQAASELQALGIDLALLRSSMDSLEVDFSKSRRTNDSLYYSISGKVGTSTVTMEVAALRDYMIDSTATLLYIRRK